MLSAATSRTHTSTREVIGIYRNDEELSIAINDLINAGISSSHIGLVANKNAVKEQLEQSYREVSASPSTPHFKVEFVGKRSAKSNISLRLGGLGPLNPCQDNPEVVASRSVLASAAFKTITGESKNFQYGLSTVEQLVKPSKIAEPNSVSTLAEALVDDRLLLLVSEQDSKMNTAKEVLEFSNSVDEGIVEVSSGLNALD